MKLPCSEPSCKAKIRWQDQETRGQRMITVDRWQWPIFCSVECAVYAGVYDFRTGLTKPESEWHIQRPFGSDPTAD